MTDCYTDCSIDQEQLDAAVVGTSPVTANAAGGVPSRSAASVVFLIILLGGLTALGPLAIDMYLPSFPTIAEDFGTTVASVQQTLVAYFAGLALGQLFYGPATDRFGRKPPLYAGLLLFILTSIGCTFADSVLSLAAMRFLQALGGCSAMVVTRAVIRDSFEERDAARAFSSLMLVMGLAPIIAPLLGGWLAVHLGWRSVFMVLTVGALLCLLAVVLFLRESLPTERRRRDGVSATVTVYARLLKDRTFITHTLAGSLASAALFAYVSGSPFVFIDLYHVHPEQFGLYFGANALGLILAAQVNSYLAYRVDPRRTIRVAMVVAAAASGTLVLATVTRTGGFVGVFVPLFVFISSLGFILPTSVALAMAPHGGVAGNASALFGFVQFLLSGTGGMMVSLLQNGTAVPLALVIASFIFTALLINLRFARGEACEPLSSSEIV